MGTVPYRPFPRTVVSKSLRIRLGPDYLSLNRTQSHCSFATGDAIGLSIQGRSHAKNSASLDVNRPSQVAVSRIY